MSETFQVIYVDPPWDYKGQKQHGGIGKGVTGGAISHYPTISLQNLKDLSVLDIVDEDCLMFMWT